MFGDLYQLSPVAKRDEEEELGKYYNSLYFFSCKALQRLAGFLKILQFCPVHYRFFVYYNNF